MDITQALDNKVLTINGVILRSGWVSIMHSLKCINHCQQIVFFFLGGGGFVFLLLVLMKP